MRTRLIFAFTLVVVVSVLSMIFITRQGTARGLRQYFLHGGLSSSELAASLESYYNQNGSWEGVAQVLDQLDGSGQGMMGRGMGQGMGAAMGQRLRVADAKGNVFADTSTNPDGLPLTEEEISVAVPLTNRLGKTIGYLAIEGGLGYSPGDELPLLNRLNQAGLQAALVAGAIALALALVLAYQIGKPVQQLTQAAMRVAAGDLDQQVPASGGGRELRTLGETFNHMAASLKQASASRKAMTADIAHELRTPLSVQRAQLEALQDGIYPLNLENLQPLVDQNHQLSRLVDDLRTLALADAGELVLEKTKADLSELIGRAVEAMRPQAGSLGVAVEAMPALTPNGKHLLVDSGRLEQILVNLLSNALRHTPSGGRVRIEHGFNQQEVWIRVSDTGQGIPVESLPHIFDRFYRADHSRSRQQGGTGLGLAIARQLAEAHGGKLSADNLPAGGAAFTLTLPLES